MNSHHASDLTLDRLRSLLAYDAITGQWTWRVSRGGKLTGSRAGYLNPDGYWRIEVDGRVYLAHRLAVFYMTGEWPIGDVDHENTNKSDISWKNLRPATKSQNMANARLRKHNKSGRKGVSWHKEKRKWVAQLRHDGKLRFLGYFDDVNEAGDAYDIAAKKTFGEFYRPGAIDELAGRL